MELDPKFVDVIVKRWEDFTGKKAVLERAEPDRSDSAQLDRPQVLDENPLEN
jgi:hypothetical protein